MGVAWCDYEIFFRIRSRELVEIDDQCVGLVVGCKQGYEAWTNIELIFVCSNALYKCRSISESWC